MKNMKKALCFLPVFFFVFTAVCLAAQPLGGAGKIKAPSVEAYKALPEMGTPPGPVSPPQGEWAHVAAGYQYTCAIDGKGRLWCWGDNQFGQLGIGKSKIELDHAKNPVLVSSDMWKSVSSKSYHVCAIKEDGTLWCWGHNGYGQLGSGDLEIKTVPNHVGTDTDWAAVSAGIAHTCGLKEDGTILCWGDNRHGELGDGTYLPRYSSVRAGSDEWLAVSVGAMNTCAVKEADGMTYCWGWNNYGQLGNGSISIAQKVNAPAPVTGEVRNLSLLSLGSGYACGVVNPDGEGKLYCWGNDRYGQLGNGDSSTHDMRYPYPVSGYMDWIKIDTGHFHACGIKKDNVLYCWGDNYFGELGDGTSGEGNFSSGPKEVYGGMREVSAGYGHTCGITVGGEMYCWGYNERGQLGNGNTVDQTSPVRVVPLMEMKGPPLRAIPPPR